MKRRIALMASFAILVVLACSAVWSEKAQEIWMGDYLLFRIRVPAAGYSVSERVAAIQERTNSLLREKKESISLSVEAFGSDANIYTDGKFYMTVTKQDAKVNGTTPMKLAQIWADRIHNAFVKTYPDCDQCRIQEKL